MAEEFQAGICGGTWWNPSKSMFPGCSSPYSLGIADMGVGFGWPTDMGADIKGRSCEESNNSVSDTSLAFQCSHQKPQQADSDSGGSSVLIDSTLQMMGFGLSSSTTTSDWNQSLLRCNGRAESNYNSVDSSQIQKEWSPGEDSSSTTTFVKTINNQEFLLDQQRLDSVSSSGNSTATCQGGGFPMSSPSPTYGYPPSTAVLLQSLFETDPQPQQQSLFNNRSINHMSSTSAATYGASATPAPAAVDELSPSWPKIAPFFKPSLPKQQQHGGLHFSNNTPFWNPSAATTALYDVRANLLPSPQMQQSQLLASSFEEKPVCGSLTAKSTNEEVRGSGSVVISKKGSSCEPAFKRPRIETPSPLPPFKVRKEKLGDRITALQQLVSPFGKTDTASVLHEAIEYIRFLHDQVSVLSTPYMKQGGPLQPQQSHDKSKEPEGPKQDLRSRGLCLVPISSTFPVANETTADFWTPTFGGTFR